jgi:mRNA interferase MazF
MATNPQPLRGEVWRVDFDPSVGAEIQKIRPAVVVSRNDAGRLPLRVIVPLTAWQTPFASWPWMVKVEADATNGLTKDSGADAFQSRSFSTERFVSRLGKLTPGQVESVAKAVAAVVGVESEVKPAKTA